MRKRLHFSFSLNSLLSLITSTYKNAAKGVRPFSIVMQIALPGGSCPDLFARLQPHVRLHSSAWPPLVSMSDASHQPRSILDDRHTGVPVSVHAVLKREWIYAGNRAGESSRSSVVPISFVWSNLLKDDVLVFDEGYVAWAARLEYNHIRCKCIWKKTLYELKWCSYKLGKLSCAFVYNTNDESLWNASVD